MKLIHLLAAIWIAAASPAFATITVDSGLINGFTNSGANCTGAVVTTSLGGDIVVVNTINTNVGVTVTSISDTAGLVWNKRFPVFGTGRYSEEWWAYAPAALTSDAITVTFSSSGFTACAVRGGAYAGANPTNPFDTNASLPAINSSASASSIGVTISTNNPNTMLLGFIGENSPGFGTLTRPTGFTILGTTGSFNDNSNKLVSSIQSNLALNYSWTGGSQLVLMLVDALQAPLGGAPSSINLSSGFR